VYHSAQVQLESSEAKIRINSRKYLFNGVTAALKTTREERGKGK
jgi:hypothetical protein